MSFGTKLKELRLNKGLNKTEFAKELGVSHVQIIRYERDETLPSTDKLKHIADFFEVTLDYLLGDNKKTGISNVIVTEKELIKLFQLPDDSKEKVFEYIDLLHAKCFSGGVHR